MLIQTSDVWSMAEMCTAIMVVSLPSLRPLLRKNRPTTDSSPDSSSPHKPGEKPISQAMNRVRSSIISSRNAYTINNSGSPDASDLELIHVSPQPKNGWHVENAEVHQQGRVQQQSHPQRQRMRRMASFDSRTPPERSKEWV